MNIRRSIPWLTSLVVLASASSAGAVATNWKLAGTGAWDNVNNWDNGVPGAGFDATVDKNGTAQISVDATAKSLTIGTTNGGTVQQTDKTTKFTDLFIAGQAKGEYDLSNTGVLDPTNEYVGYQSIGLLLQKDANSTNVPAQLIIGSIQNSSGRYLQQDGALNDTGKMVVGEDGGGTYTLNGGTAHVGADLVVGQSNFGSGLITVFKGLTVNGGIYLGGDAQNATGGKGVFITGADPAAIVTANSLRVGATSSYSLFNTAKIDTIDILDKGSISGTGTFAPRLNAMAAMTNAGTVFLSSQDTIGVSGTYMQKAGGTLDITLGAGVTNGLLDVTGTAALAASLTVRIGNAVLAGGQKYTILKSAGGVNGTFSNVTLPNPPIGTAWFVDYNANNVVLRLTPEPGTWVLAALGGVGLFLASAARRRMAQGM